MSIINDGNESFVYTEEEKLSFVKVREECCDKNLASIAIHLSLEEGESRREKKNVNARSFDKSSREYVWLRSSIPKPPDNGKIF